MLLVQVEQPKITIVQDTLGVYRLTREKILYLTLKEFMNIMMKILDLMDLLIMIRKNLMVMIYL